MAEFVFKKMVKDLGVEEKYCAASFATSDEEIWGGVGNKIHRGTVGIFTKYNIPYDKEKRAVQLTPDDYGKYDLFIGMDYANIRNMRYIFPSDPQEKIKLLLSFANEEGEVADPWYTGNFEATYTDVVRGCNGLLRTLGEAK